MNFEEKLNKLENLSAVLSDGTTDLESALSSFEEGMKITRELEKELEKIEGKIEILVENKNTEEKPEKKKTKDEKSFSLELFQAFNDEEEEASDVVGTRK